MSPSPPLRKSGIDAPFEAGLLTHGLNTELIYEVGIDGMGRGDEFDSKNTERPRSPM